MNFSTKTEFDKEFRKLRRKYRSLENDLEVLKKFLRVHPCGFPPGILRMTDTGVDTEIYKVKHFRCKTLSTKGSKSGIRITYAYIEADQLIEFIEIYYKERGDTECNKERIKQYYG